MAATKNVDIKILSFFEDVTTPKEFAKALRRATHLIALSYIRSEDNTNPMNMKWVDETYYILNELAECIDPVLED